MPSTLFDDYTAWQSASPVLSARTIAALARAALAVLAAAPDPDPAVDAARRAWAAAASVDPGRYEPQARWRVIASDAYATAGADLDDDALLAVVTDAVDGLAALS